MNNDLKQLERQLVRATAPGADSRDLDPETQGLREGWLALARLLEAVEDQCPPRTASWKTPPRARPRRWRLPMIVALAASLLIVCVGAWAWIATSTRGGPGAQLPQTAKPDDQTRPKLTPTPAAALAAKSQVLSPAPRQAAPVTDGPQWDDSLDEQLAQAGQNVIRVEAGWRLHGAAVASVQRGVEQVRQEIDENNL
jgi:hypothetical protein